MSKPDIDGTAAQIMVIAFTQPNAREQIAHILELTRLGGELEGIAEARRIYNECISEQPADGGKS